MADVRSITIYATFSNASAIPMPPLTQSVATPRLTLQHLVKQRDRNTRSAAADGMSQRNSAAIDVELAVIEMKLAIAGQHLRGKGFVKLDHIEAGEFQIMFLFHFAQRGKDRKS